MLEKLDMNRKLSEKQYDEQISAVQVRLRELEFVAFKRQIPVLCMFEGWDAAGKGGAIKRVTEMLDPRGYTVSSYAAPRGEEKSHHYLWRFWRNLPRAGQAAPDFELPDQHGKMRSLAEFRGSWVVLYFFPKADTPG